MFTKRMLAAVAVAMLFTGCANSQGESGPVTLTLGGQSTHGDAPYPRWRNWAEC